MKNLTADIMIHGVTFTLEVQPSYCNDALVECFLVDAKIGEEDATAFVESVLEDGEYLSEKLCREATRHFKEAVNV
jgi:hypothetical protein